MAAVSISLAMVGLAQYGDANGRFTQGRSQAVCAIVFSGLAMTVGLALFFRPPPPINRPAQGQTINSCCWNFKFSAPGHPWVQSNRKAINASVTLAFTRAIPGITFMNRPDVSLQNSIRLTTRPCNKPWTCWPPELSSPKRRNN